MTEKLQTYFKLVGFPTLKEFDQIKHLLFFITSFAGIREDMTTKVIASRLARLQKVSCERMAEYTQHVKDTMHENTDILKEIAMRGPGESNRGRWDPDDPINSDRDRDELAYRLHNHAIKALQKESDDAWSGHFNTVSPSTYKKRLVRWLIFALLVVAAVIVASAIHFYRGEPPDVFSATAVIETPVSIFWASFILMVGGIIGEAAILSQISNNSTTRATQLKNYLDLVGFRQKIRLEKIVHLLYYVTKVAGLREDMTAKVIASRLAGFRKRAYRNLQSHKEYENSVAEDMRKNSDAVMGKDSPGSSPTTRANKKRQLSKLMQKRLHLLEPRQTAGWGDATNSGDFASTPVRLMFVEIPENLAVSQWQLTGTITPPKRTWSKKDPANIDREHGEIEYALHENVIKNRE